jgi:hypothetical protein
MTDQQANIDEQQTSVRSPDASAAPIGETAPAEPVFERDDGWFDDREELPPRPRRRLLTPLPLALLAALAIACGFIAGVLVEKGQGGSSSSGAAAGLASRFAAAGRTGSTSTSGSGLAGIGTRGAASGASGGGGASGGATVGQVAYVSKGALYVTTLEGNTVKVTAAPGATVTRSVKATASAIHPGETVVVTGSTGSNGAIAAQSIRAGAAGAAGLTGGAGLFGGAAARTSGAAAGGSGASGGTGGSGGEQALFGKG